MYHNNRITKGVFTHITHSVWTCCIYAPFHTRVICRTKALNICCSSCGCGILITKGPFGCDTVMVNFEMTLLGGN